MRKEGERYGGGGWRGRRGEVVRRRMERNEGEEGGREAVGRRKSEKGSEEDDYFNKISPDNDFSGS